MLMMAGAGQLTQEIIMRRLLLASLALIACGGAAPPPDTPDRQSQLNDAKVALKLQGLTPGEPVDCIPLFRARYSTEVIGNVILYKSNSRLVYRNDTRGGCDSSGYGSALVSRNYESGICRGLIIQSIDLFTGLQSGSCSLGSFTPYTKAK